MVDFYLIITYNLSIDNFMSISSERKQLEAVNKEIEELFYQFRDYEIMAKSYEPQNLVLFEKKRKILSTIDLILCENSMNDKQNSAKSM